MGLIIPKGGKMRCQGLSLILISLLLASCGGPRSYAENEEFRSDPRYHRDFQVAASPLCNAARRVLLADGYVVTEGEGQSLSGGKEFQVEEKYHAILHLYITCDQRAGGSILFVTATEEHFDVKTDRQSTTIGAPLVAPITFGSRSETDRQVKIRGETVTERDFYERFYRAVQRELAR
jgi:hypothetical protein